MKSGITETGARLLFALAVLVSVLSVAAICLFLFAKGIPAMRQIGVVKFLTGMTWSPSSGEFGIFPMIVGSVYATAGALIIGLPPGILTAVFLAYYCPKKLYGIAKPAVDLLAGIPSVVYGLFGLTMIVPLVRSAFGGSGSSLLAASLVLGIMILPTVTSITEASLRAVPNEIYEGSRALGASREKSVFGAVATAAKSGIMSAVVLGTGRAIGETMAVIMVAGNQALIPHSLTDGIRTLTANIVIEMGYAADLHRGALIATAVVLFVFIMIINVAFSLLSGVQRGDRSKRKR